MKYTFESAFSPYITGLIEQKHADGFYYTAGESHLKQFDTFCKERYPEAKTISYELAMEWSVIRSTEKSGFRNDRLNALRQLSLYMLSLGMDAYVPRNFMKVNKPVLYVPTREEMTAFFKEMSAWKNPRPKYQRFIDECKIMFLLYYCCGMRLSEARLLKKEHIDWNKGILTIFASKGQKDRLVYLPQGGVDVLADYLSYIEKIAPDSPWMFPGWNPSQPVTSVLVDSHFKECWTKLPFAANANKCPTPHCLRHAFVVERMNDWMLRGIETQTMIAYLSKYLGHKSTSETFYYYHLVKRAFSVIKEKDRVSGRVIPEVTPYEDH